MARKLSNDELGRLSKREFKDAPKHAVTIVLDNVRSLHNVGSAFRTADAFRIEQILLCGVTGTPPHREIEKTALGATTTVNWKYFKTTHEAVSILRSSGYAIYAIEQAEALFGKKEGVVKKIKRKEAKEPKAAGETKEKTTKKPARGARAAASKRSRPARRSPPSKAAKASSRSKTGQRGRESHGRHPRRGGHLSPHRRAI